MTAALTREPSAAILETVTELAARWHRADQTTSEFKQGLREGWVQSISLMLDVPFSVVKEALIAGEL